MFKEKRELNKVEKAVVLIVMLFAFCFFIQVSSASASEITAQNVIQLVNKERLSQGISALAENEILDRAAADKLNDMISGDYFAHTSPKGILPWYWFDKAGYDYKYAGENLAINFESAESEHKAWMASTTHRKNILNPNYQEIGIAVGRGKIDSEVSTLVVQLFGTQVAGVSTSKNPEPASQEKEARISDPALAENVIVIPESVKAPEINPNSIDIKNPICENGVCRFSDNNSVFSQNKNINEGVAWIFVILILAVSIGINTYTLNRHHKHNPFIAANTVVLLMALTSMVMWKI